MVGSSTALFAAVDVDEDGKLDIICQTFSTTDSKYDLKLFTTTSTWTASS